MCSCTDSIATPVTIHPFSRSRERQTAMARSHQKQFLNVFDRDTAREKFHAALRLDPLESVRIPLAEALGRVLASDVVSGINVPAFDRANFDGFAVVADDTQGADEETPRRLKLRSEILKPGASPDFELKSGEAVTIATGGMIPRGSDAIAMVEHADVEDTEQVVVVRRASASGFGLTYAGSDIAVGETVLRFGRQLSSRETGVLAAMGEAEVDVVRRPRVAVISTGDEIVPPGQPLPLGKVYDSNSTVLCDAVREMQCEAVPLGVVRDDLPALEQMLSEALAECDAVVLSGGTSKGAGDLSYQAVAKLNDPGVLVHGVALKPGKPVCLAASDGKPIAVLPGFPASALFTFREFVAPVLYRLAGRGACAAESVRARLATTVASEVGRTEYRMVHLTAGVAESPEDDPVSLTAHPVEKGSWSVTGFAQADGYIEIDRHQERLDAEQTVQVQLTGSRSSVELVCIGSHCPGLDRLLNRLQRSGIGVKFVVAGSTAGLRAVARGECHLAGIHLLDAKTEQYNTPFLSKDLRRMAGYSRRQGVVVRSDDVLAKCADGIQAIETAAELPEHRLIHRNPGSGTRILLDEFLKGRRPLGWRVQCKSHSAVAAAIAQGRADWGVAVEFAARHEGLTFLPLRHERFDLVQPVRWSHSPVWRRCVSELESSDFQEELRELGFDHFEIYDG